MYDMTANLTMTCMFKYSCSFVPIKGLEANNAIFAFSSLLPCVYFKQLFKSPHIYLSNAFGAQLTVYLIMTKFLHMTKKFFF